MPKQFTKSKEVQTHEEVDIEQYAPCKVHDVVLQAWKGRIMELLELFGKAN